MLLTLAVIVVIVAFLFWLLDKLKINPSGRYVLITGCDTGFGNALAKSLDQKGCHVFATCLTTKGMEVLKKSTSERLHAIIMDVTSSESIKAAYKEVQGRLPKGSGLWGLVNNAGITGGLGYYDWWTRDEFRQVLDVNLLGPIDVTNVFLPLVKKVKGRIVNISSAVALTPFSSGGYEMSKSALETFSDCLRHQMLYYSISVHIIQPAFFLTNLTDNVEYVNGKLEMAWNRMTQEQRDEYGRHCIENYKHDVVEGIKQISDTRLYLVTDAIEHALFARFPWKRYPIGGIVRFISRPLSVLPTFMWDFVRNRVVSLPKPQSCK